MVKRNAVEKPSTDPDLLQLITEKEWSTREQRYQQRIQDVKVCLGFISGKRMIVTYKSAKLFLCRVH